MRISKELIQSAHEKTNPIKERMLDFRGFKIAVFENLGLVPDYIECLDFTDNNIIKLENFPPMPHLKTIMAANNMLSRIDTKFIDPIPNLNSLVLTNNKIESLSDLLPLSSAKNLTRLTLCDNPVTLVQHYRFFCIQICPSLRFLDFQRITDKERHESKSLFAGSQGKTLISQIAPPRSKLAESTSEVKTADELVATKDETEDKTEDKTEDEDRQIKRRKLNELTKSILNASSVSEVTNLQQQMKQLAN